MSDGLSGSGSDGRVGWVIDSHPRLCPVASWAKPRGQSFFSPAFFRLPAAGKFSAFLSRRPESSARKMQQGCTKREVGIALYGPHPQADPPGIREELERLVKCHM